MLRELIRTRDGTVEPVLSDCRASIDYQMKEKENDSSIERIVNEIFEDFESKSNIVGLYALLLRIDKRENPHLYAGEVPNQDP